MDLGPAAGIAFGHHAADAADLAEMIEAQPVWPSHQGAGPGEGQWAADQIPTGDVAAGIAQDVHLVEQCRCQVAISLIGEQPCGDVVIAGLV